MCSNKYDTLIVLYPKDSSAVYLDSGSGQKKKEYKHIKAVLDDALNGYSYREGIIKRQNLRRGKLIFSHRTEFPCMKQAPGSTREVWYAILHMREYVKDQQQLQFLSSLKKWCNSLADTSDAEIRKEFGRNQQMIVGTIWKDLVHRDGVFYYGPAPPPNADIVRHIRLQGDDRPFNSLDGCLPFPPIKPKPSKK